jgi:rhodanese-related sulfurtransferase
MTNTTAPTASAHAGALRLARFPIFRPEVGRVTISEFLETARRRLNRVHPWQLRDAMAAGAVVIDVRPEFQQERDGLIPGAHIVTRNALEWRVDPASGYSDPGLGEGFDRRIILVCDEGYQSSLAAATLQDLGFTGATDLVGGFQAWRAAGLAVRSTVCDDERLELEV